MKLPWDEKYLKISFHVIFTAVVVYLLVHVINLGAYIFSHLDKIINNFSQFLSSIFSVFSILFCALIISYLLDPLVNRLQNFYNEYTKKHDLKKRTAGTILAYLIVFFIIFAFIFVLVKKMDVNHNVNFVENFSAAAISTINDLNESYLLAQEKLKQWGMLEYVSDFVNTALNSLIKFFRSLSNNIISTLTSAGSKVLDLFLSLVVAFYLLRDKVEFQNKVSDVSKVFLPKKIYPH